MNKQDELVLTITRQEALPKGGWYGIRPHEAKRIETLAREKGKFLLRGDIEDNPSIKQIAPYVVFKYKNSLFLMRRRDDHSDQRLASKLSLGISGHLREEDLLVGDTIWDWAKRELDEEVEYDSDLTYEILGAINNDKDRVGQVHLGIVILATGVSPNITIKEEFKSGELVNIQRLPDHYDQMESWAQIVTDFLLE
jgi:predicted NUDIX family phosphoesterase